MDRISALFHYLELLRKLEETNPAFGERIVSVIMEIDRELEIKRL